MAPPPLLEAKTITDEIYYPEGDGKPIAESDVHFQLSAKTTLTLQAYYRDESHVYVAANNFLYYVKGNPRKSVSPDVYVVYGVEKRLRKTYKVWAENGIVPSVIFEFTSDSTKGDDNDVKFPLYEQVLKADEYFRYDPTGDYLNPRLQGFRLERGEYQSIPLENGDRLYSQNLQLFLVMIGEDFRFYDPKTREFLKTPEETREAYEATRQAYEATRQAYEATRQAYEDEQQLRLDAIERANTEAERARNAEEENVRLRAELERLKQGKRAE